MSINFATLKGLAIPEGNVTQIADASGRVLWKQAPSGATVTITVNSGYEKDILLIDGVYYGMQSAELTVPIGTVIATSGATQVTIFKAGVQQTTIQGNYNYTVTGDVDVHITGTKPNPYYTVYIVQFREP